jgi:hypothetical protein
MQTRRRFVLRSIAAGLAGTTAYLAWRHGHDYIFPEQFVVVEQGKLYRGAWQKPWPMRAIVHDCKIKTILALAHPPDHHLCKQEQKLAQELGVKWIHIPIVDNRTDLTGDPEEAISDQLDKAAAVLANPANYPIYFHCHHGLNRTSMTQIAYRTKYCGWTFEQAAEEIDRSVGLVKVAHGPDYRHMIAYYQNRVLPFRTQNTRRAGNGPTPLAQDVFEAARTTRR